MGFMKHDFSTITIAELRERLFHNNFPSKDFWIFHLYEGIDVDADREGPEFYPYGPRISCVSDGMYKGERIIDLTYGINNNNQYIGFRDVMEVAKEHNFPDTTKIYLRKFRSFEFQPIKNIYSCFDLIFFEPY